MGRLLRQHSRWKSSEQKTCRTCIYLLLRLMSSRSQLSRGSEPSAYCCRSFCRSRVCRGAAHSCAHASILGGSGHRLYQKTVLKMTVWATLGTFGGLWIALVQTQVAAGTTPGNDGSGSADGELSDLALRRRSVVVATFLIVEILVRSSTSPTHFR